MGQLLPSSNLGVCGTHNKAMEFQVVLGSGDSYNHVM